MMKGVATVGVHPLTGPEFRLLVSDPLLPGRDIGGAHFATLVPARVLRIVLGVVLPCQRPVVVEVVVRWAAPLPVSLTGALERVGEQCSAQRVGNVEAHVHPGSTDKQRTVPALGPADAAGACNVPG